MNFWKEQEILAARIASGELRLIYLDPDGTYSGWISLIIHSPTRVAYATQCGGVANDQRIIEGYLIPLNGSAFDEPEPLSRTEFTSIFHRGRKCIYTWTGEALPSARLTELDNLIQKIPYWINRSVNESSRAHINLDYSRLNELCEGWVPVITPDGPGILVFDNCD